MASANAKPNIPMAGAMMLPVVAVSTNSVPIMGPVHEKDTSANVNAMKNILSRPVVASARASILLVHDAGNTSSKAPKNDMAKNTNRAKKIRLKTALVDKSFSALAPNIPVMASPNNTYITMMETPYKTASEMAFFLFALLRFKKKLTVMGISGHTQGVSSAMIPPAKPAIRIHHNDCPVTLPFMPYSRNSSITGVHNASLSTSEGSSEISKGANSKSDDLRGVSSFTIFSCSKSAATTSVVSTTVAGRSDALKAKSSGNGGVHSESSHDWARTSPSNTNFDLSVTLKRCTNLASLS